MKRHNKSLFFALLSVIFWATAATAFKISLRYLDLFQLLFISSVSSLLIFFVFILLKRELPVVLKSSRKEIFTSFLLGLFNPFFYYLVLFKAYSLLPAQVAQPLNFVWPIVLVLLSIPLLGQKLTFTSFFALIISFAGVFIISTQGRISTFHINQPLGVILALGSSVIWSLFWILNVRDKRSSLVKLFTSFLFAACLSLIVTLCFSGLKNISLNGLLGGIYIGCFEMGITFLLWMKALEYSSSAAYVGNLIYLTPFFSLLMIHFVLGEHIFASTILGLVLIVGGISIQQARKLNNKSSV